MDVEDETGEQILKKRPSLHYRRRSPPSMLPLPHAGPALRLVFSTVHGRHAEKSRAPHACNWYLKFWCLREYLTENRSCVLFTKPTYFLLDNYCKNKEENAFVNRNSLLVWWRSFLNVKSCCCWSQRCGAVHSVSNKDAQVHLVDNKHKPSPREKKNH
jgi:hypothetical protein